MRNLAAFALALVVAGCTQTAALTAPTPAPQAGFVAAGTITSDTEVLTGGTLTVSVPLTNVGNAAGAPRFRFIGTDAFGTVTSPLTFSPLAPGATGTYRFTLRVDADKGRFDYELWLGSGSSWSTRWLLTLWTCPAGDLYCWRPAGL